MKRWQEERNSSHLPFHVLRSTLKNSYFLDRKKNVDHDLRDGGAEYGYPTRTFECRVRAAPLSLRAAQKLVKTE